MLTILLEGITEGISEDLIFAWILKRWVSWQIDQLITQQKIEVHERELFYRNGFLYTAAVAKRLEEMNAETISLYIDFGMEDYTNIQRRWYDFFAEDRITQLARRCCPFQANHPSTVGLYGKSIIKQLSQIDYDLPRANLPLFLNGYEGSEILAADLNLRLIADDTNVLSHIFSNADTDGRGE